MATTLTDLRAAWDAPFLADPGDDSAVAARSAQTTDLAAAILASRPGDRVGALVLNRRGWPADAGDRADAAASAVTDPAGWMAAGPG